jgi:hypothetical protein
MTFTQASSPDRIKVQSVSLLHLKAAEHLELACRSHKAAAQLHVWGDHKGADFQAVMAREHTAKAGEHVNEAIKKSGPTGSLQ